MTISAATSSMPSTPARVALLRRFTRRVSIRSCTMGACRPKRSFHSSSCKAEIPSISASDRTCSWLPFGVSTAMQPPSRKIRAICFSWSPDRSAPPSTTSLPFRTMSFVPRSSVDVTWVDRRRTSAAPVDPSSNWLSTAAGKSAVMLTPIWSSVGSISSSVRTS